MDASRLPRRAFLNLLGAAPLAATTHAPAAHQTTPPGAASLTDAGGLRVGHFTDRRRPTGCTFILFDQPARAGADYNGSAPAESLGVTLQPTSPLDRIHAIVLTGGGPMALGATAGAVRFLEEQGVGYDWGVPNVRVPIVVGAAIDDLSIGDGRIRVGADEAYRACQSATTTAVLEGSVGVGAPRPSRDCRSRRGQRSRRHHRLASRDDRRGRAHQRRPRLRAHSGCAA